MVFRCGSVEDVVQYCIVSFVRGMAPVSSMTVWVVGCSA